MWNVAWSRSIQTISDIFGLLFEKLYFSRRQTRVWVSTTNKHLVVAPKCWKTPFIYFQHCCIFLLSFLLILSWKNFFFKGLRCLLWSSHLYIVKLNFLSQPLMNIIYKKISQMQFQDYSIQFFAPSFFFSRCNY